MDLNNKKGDSISRTALYSALARRPGYNLPDKLGRLYKRFIDTLSSPISKSSERATKLPLIYAAFSEVDQPRKKLILKTAYQKSRAKAILGRMYPRPTGGGHQGGGWSIPISNSVDKRVE